jgi:hypothetical protein
MKSNREIIEAVAEELSSKLGRPAEEIIEKGLSAYDFNADEVKIVFDDGSSANFKYSFYVENPIKNVIAVFTEHCGYHLFRSSGVTVMAVPESWVEIDEAATYCCERFKEAVSEGNIRHADDIPDETEWYLPETGHIYFCPFCGSHVKGDGFGTYDKDVRKGNTQPGP